MKCAFDKTTSFKAQHGFTLVELITVIILLGIISIAAVPRFTGTIGYAEYAFQRQALSALRNIQLKAMYDTRNTFCYKFVFSASSPLAFGPTASSYLPSDGQAVASCNDEINFNSDAFLRTDTDELDSANVAVSAFDGVTSISTLQFDSLGRVSTPAGACISGCRVDFIGDDTASICVENEGYVYAC